MTIQRKYLLEGALHQYSSGASLLRPCDLYDFESNQEIRDALEGCNIYLIARRKKISICPTTLKIDTDTVKGEFRVHDVFDFERYRFSLPRVMHTPTGAFVANHVSARDSFGHEIVLSNGTGSNVVMPSHALVAQATHGLKQHTDLEVLYIGQGIGRKSDRLAIDRLSAHKTFQKILCDNLHDAPDSEILLLLFRYEHIRIMASTAGDFSVEPSASQADELSHMKMLGDSKVSRRNRISLAEAALIFHFKPKYNFALKDRFPGTKAKLLRELCSHDLSGLVVEISTLNIQSRLKTSHRPPNSLENLFSKEQLDRVEEARALRVTTREAEQFLRELTHVHIAKIPLFSHSDRESFLHALPWQSA